MGELVATQNTCEKEELLDNLKTLRQIKKADEKQLPVYRSFYGTTGYLQMPSARVAKEGGMAIFYSQFSNASLFGVGVQLLEGLEFSGSYTTIHGSKESKTDKIVHFKYAIPTWTNGNKQIPKIAIGYEDSRGVNDGRTFYGVCTKEFVNQGAEFSFGYGTGRIRGFFIGGSWTPLPEIQDKNLVRFTAHFDAGRENHLWGGGKENARFPLNVGGTVGIGKHFEVTGQRSKEEKYNFGAALKFPLGSTKEVVSKREKFKLHVENKGSTDELEIDGVRILFQERVENCLHLFVENKKWLNVNKAINQVVCAIEDQPQNYEEVEITLVSKGVLSTSYRISKADLQQLKTVDYPLCYIEKNIAAQTPGSGSGLRGRPVKNQFNYFLGCRVLPFFSGQDGDLKTDVSMGIGGSGLAFGSVYYNFLYSIPIASSHADKYTAKSHNLTKQLQVRTDVLKYYNHKPGIIDSAYCQSVNHLGNGKYVRGAVGYFEPAYGGVAAEYLYYPVGSRFAVGGECAVLKKRKYGGFGFKQTVPKIEGNETKYKRYTHVQPFVNFYYMFPKLGVDCAFSAGQFLAKDWGGKVQLKRRFNNGLTFSFWYTLTGAKDIVNGRNYRNQGIAFQVPTDIFSKKHSKNFFISEFSAWLRDVGAQGKTGDTLFSVLREERR